MNEHVIAALRGIVGESRVFVDHDVMEPYSHDEVVGRAAIHTLLGGVRESARRHVVRIVSFGHAGDGNVHVNVLKDSLADDRWAARLLASTASARRGGGTCRWPWTSSSSRCSSASATCSIRVGF